MKNGAGKANVLVLRESRRRLNLAQVKRKEIARVVARVFNVNIPNGAKAQYELLARFNRLPFDDAVLSSAALFSSGYPRPVPTIQAGRQAARPSVASSGRSFEASDAFLSTYEWRRLRMVVLTKRGARCECCGATPSDGVRMHVDHIKPRRKHPELALTESNLQILCEVCNHGKGSWDQTDWRADRAQPGESFKDSPVPGTVTVTERENAMAPRLSPVRRR